MLSTFQSLVLAAIGTITTIIPAGTKPAIELTAAGLGWPLPPPSLLAAIGAGTSTALFLYFFHDWLSSLSGFIRTVFFLKRPMVLDERLPFFILATVVPWFITALLIRHGFLSVPTQPLIEIGLLVFGTFFFWWGARHTKRNKRMLELNIVDALGVGFFQTLGMSPAVLDRTILGLGFALTRGYQWDSAIKFIFLALLPITLFDWLSLPNPYAGIGSHPAAELTWLSFGAAATISLILGLLCIDHLVEKFRTGRSGLIYPLRIIVTLGLIARAWHIWHTGGAV